MISKEIVTQTWQRMARTPTSEASMLIETLKQEQPVILGYLMSLENLPFNQHEREIIFYIGVVVWQIMRESNYSSEQITFEQFRMVEDANYNFLEMLASDTEADFVSAVQSMLETYPEPEVLAYIIEAIMEDDNPDDPPIRDEYRGLAFIELKIVLDALLNKPDWPDRSDASPQFYE